MNLKKILLLVLVIGMNLTAKALNFSSHRLTTTMIEVLDEEYDRFRKQGDDLFRKGEYDKALKKYLACLEVPNYSKDTYANTKISQCRRAIALRNDISKAKTDDNTVVAKMEELLQINSEDASIKERASDYWIRKGNEKLDIGALLDAKNAFEKASIYRNDEQVKELIKRCEEQIKLAESTKSIGNNGGIGYNPSPKGLGLKIGVGVVAIGAAVYALKLNGDWQDKLSALNAAKITGSYIIYDNAYNEASKAKDSEGLRNACVGVAIAAVATEVYLLIRKPKTTEPKISFLPTNNLGLSLNYKF